MKRRKRLPSLLLALVMAISLFPGSALGVPEPEPMESSEMKLLEATAETTPELMVELEATFELPEKAEDNLYGSYPENTNEGISGVAGEGLSLGLLSNVTTVSDIALLQNAIDMATADDVIVLDLVSPATLPTTLNIDKSLTFYSEDQLTLFAGSGRHISVSGADVALTFGNIILDGQSIRGGIISSASSLSLDSVSIQKISGAGVYSETGCNLDITDCVIAESTNRGIYCGGNITVVDSVIEKNKGGSGGGIYSAGSVMVSGSTKVNNNTATDGGTGNGGGGIFATGDVTVLDNAQICDNTLTASSTPGGGIRVIAEGATVTIDGGIINNNTATSSGGGISVTNNRFNSAYNVNVFISGDTVISGNKAGASGSGGGLYVAGNIVMSGGTISENTARSGGGIYVPNLYDDADAPVPGATTLTVSGGLISGNIATSTAGGGGIHNTHASGKTIITGDAEITYNQVSVNGDGGALSSAGDVQITGGLIAYNEARHGGAVYWNGEGKTFEISDGEIRNNIARTDGGAIFTNVAFAEYTELKMSGGKINNNTAQTGNGGAVNASRTALEITMSGGEVSENRALAGKGGGIYSEATTIQLSNTLFKSNTALNGGGIYGNSWSIIKVGDGSKFLYNNATGSGTTDGGGGIYIETLSNLTTEVGSVFSGNKAVRAVNLTSASLISQHGTKILGTIYTDPFIYLYNNYDVNVPDSAGTVMQIHSVAFNYNYADAQEPYERVNVVAPETTVGSKMPTDPTRDHYEFSGWNTQADGLGSEFTSASTVAADITVFASWVPVTYTISFESNGGTAVADITGVFFDDSIMEPVPPTKEHHTFAGWYKEPALTDVWDFSVDKVAGNTTLYAKWTPNNYTVTFEPGTQGTMLPDPATELVVYNANITSIPAVMENAGWVCIGWESSQTGLLYNDADLMVYPVTDDVTFTAQYERSEKAVVIFDYQGGVDALGNASIVLSDYPGEALICPPDPTKNGYTFNGWDRVPPATYGTAGSSITYYAQWTELVSDTTDTTDSTGLIKAAKSGESLIANTGDSLPVWLLIIFMSVAVGGGVFLRMANKRKKERN